MSDIPESTSHYQEADVRLKKSFSLVWMIPIIAVVVGAVMAVQAVMTKGPLVTITFSNASGLVAGKTQVRYKDVTVGLVESIQLNDDLSSVIVKARMDNSIKPYLVDTTVFWVEKARVGAGQVSGLSTLLSGAFIGMDPGSGTESTRKFRALDNPPVVTTGLPGRKFFLNAETLGSLNVKSPVYYKQIKVGEVISFNLKEDGSGVQTQIFVNEPYDHFVKTSSRFWNPSGIDLKLDDKGVSLNTESLTTILSGGIAFDTPVGFEMVTEAEEDAVFHLFRNYDAAEEKHFSIKHYFFAQFSNSVRGLKPGAPVEFLGFKVGEVADMKLEFDVDKVEFKAPVLFYIEPERIHLPDASIVYPEGLIGELVRRGLRVQLKSGNLLTGQLYVDLIFQEKDKTRSIDYSMAHPLLPSVPSDVVALTASVRSILDDMKQIQFKRLGADMHQTLSLLNSNLEKTDELFKNINVETLPQIESSLAALQNTMNALRKSVGNDSDLNQDTRQAMAELADAARAFKVLSEYLAKHPESLIKGKDKSE